MSTKKTPTNPVTTYRHGRGDVAAEILREYHKLGELLQRLGLESPTPTAREEFRGAEGTGAHRTPTPPAEDDSRLKGRKVLSRVYGDRTIKVYIERRPEGIYYWFDGEKWPSLSAISKHVSAGTRRGGFEFFGLGLPTDPRREG